MRDPADLIIVGGGPAGLAAAINAASEGLNVHILDNGSMLGGQARESAAIENYPGFPEGVTGNELMSRFVGQALKFTSLVSCPLSAARLERTDQHLTVTTDDFQEFPARTVLLAGGLTYRKHQAEGISQYLGRGVYYGRPGGMKLRKGAKVVVVGGANSAGQAALAFAREGCSVTLLSRSPLEKSMSAYLVARISHERNIAVEHRDLTMVSGDGTRITHWHSGEYVRQADAIVIYIGAHPRTLWLKGTVELDPANYVLAWQDLPWEHDMLETRLPFETSERGVFVAGDIRANSTKRITTAIGEGVGAVQMIHKRLAE